MVLIAPASLWTKPDRGKQGPGRGPQRNAEFGRENTAAENAWLDDKENLPIWAGGETSFSKKIDS